MDLDHINSVIAEIPLLKELLGMPNTTLFGGLLREIVAGTDIATYLTQDGGDVDVFTASNDEHVHDFFRQLVELGGFVIFNTNPELSYKGRQAIVRKKDLRALALVDLNGDFQHCFLDGHYICCLPWNDAQIHIDLIINAADSFEFVDALTINSLLFSNNSNIKRSPEHVDISIDDIRNRRLRYFQHRYFQSKQLYRAYKFYSRGYRFPESMEKMYVEHNWHRGARHDRSSIVVAKEGPKEYDVPSKRNFIVIASENNIDTIDCDDWFDKNKDSLTKMFPPHISMGLISEFDVITNDNVMVYKKAVEESSSAPKAFVIIRLLVPVGTRYFKENSTFKIRFERLMPIAFYDLDMNLLSDDLKVVSYHDKTYRYVIGQMAEPTKAFSGENHICAAGIHAFELQSMAENYQWT